MPKILCIISLVISSLIFLLFVANMLVGVPFGSSGGMLVNIGMIAGAIIVGTFSVLTFLEAR